ncbi:hypothetical protein [Paraburkholderia sp. BL21I4N1]|nr:hypothetical protein [Paraburkholderia sp. BL21I4N1]
MSRQRWLNVKFVLNADADETAEQKITEEKRETLKSKRSFHFRNQDARSQ